MHMPAKYKEPDSIWRATVAPMVADRFKRESGDRPNEKAANRLRIIVFIVGLADWGSVPAGWSAAPAKR
jgi:hypothetical protein